MVNSNYTHLNAKDNNIRAIDTHLGATDTHLRATNTHVRAADTQSGMLSTKTENPCDKNKCYKFVTVSKLNKGSPKIRNKCDGSRSMS